MAAYKLLKDLRSSLKRTEELKPHSWFGKWFKSMKTKSIKHRIEEIECDLKNKKQKLWN